MTNIPSPSPSPIRKRPTIVTWLAVVVFLLAGLNLFAGINGLLRWQVLDASDMTVPVWALLLPRGVWAVVWFILGWALLRLKPWARMGLPLAFLLYEITMIGQVFLFARQQYARTRLPFFIILALLTLALILWIISRPRVQQAFSRDTATQLDSADNERPMDR